MKNVPRWFQNSCKIPSASVHSRCMGILQAHACHGKLGSLHWRHNDHDGVSNHQSRGCLLNRLFRRRSKKTSKLRITGLCVGNSPGPVIHFISLFNLWISLLLQFWFKELLQSYWQGSIKICTCIIVMTYLRLRRHFPWYQSKLESCGFIVIVKLS